MGSILLYKLAGHPHWPVRVTSDLNGQLEIVYFGTGETGVVAGKKHSALWDFTLDNVTKFKLSQKKNPKLVMGLSEAFKLI